MFQNISYLMNTLLLSFSMIIAKYLFYHQYCNEAFYLKQSILSFLPLHINKRESSEVTLLPVYLITCLESKGWVANDKSFNNYAYLVFKQYSLPLTFKALSECAFKQHVQSIHWGATTILKWQVCNICQTLSERS